MKELCGLWLLIRYNKHTQAFSQPHSTKSELAPRVKPGYEASNLLLRSEFAVLYMSLTALCLIFRTGFEQSSFGM